MRKPIIGVTPLWDDDKSSIWMLPGYMDAIRESGGVAIILPLVASKGDIAQVCDMCDGFLLTGGHDISPSMYGSEQTKECGTPNIDRDNLEREVFNYAIERDLPVLGICRGIQIINALCGGTLYQDLVSEHIYIGIKPEINHQMTPPYDQVWHKVKVIENTPLHKITELQQMGVNSYHHQAIKTLAPTLEAMAVAEDGIIEAVWMPSKSFVMAVQWHPEFSFLSSKESRNIVASFINAAKNR
ncbi:MAG: gamma-glutamyl-gamma-aminobutyrate hydrolase family protein [Rikenellaceae bacterium]